MTPPYFDGRRKPRTAMTQDELHVDLSSGRAASRRSPYAVFKIDGSKQRLSISYTAALLSRWSDVNLSQPLHKILSARPTFCWRKLFCLTAPSDFKSLEDDRHRGLERRDSLLRLLSPKRLFYRVGQAGASLFKKSYFRHTPLIASISDHYARSIDLHGRAAWLTEANSLNRDEAKESLVHHIRVVSTSPKRKTSPEEFIRIQPQLTRSAPCSHSFARSKKCRYRLLS